jgi:hypothetical protein
VESQQAPTTPRKTSSAYWFSISRQQSASTAPQQRLNSALTALGEVLYLRPFQDMHSVLLIIWTRTYENVERFVIREIAFSRLDVWNASNLYTLVRLLAALSRISNVLHFRDVPELPCNREVTMGRHNLGKVKCLLKIYNSFGESR